MTADPLDVTTDPRYVEAEPAPPRIPAIAWVLGAAVVAAVVLWWAWVR